MTEAWIEVLDTTPVGPVTLAVNSRGLLAVEINPKDPGVWENRFVHSGIHVKRDPARTRLFKEQLAGYFAGERTDFELPIDWEQFTPFQAEVLRLQTRIPYGETRTYSELARQLGRPRAARAVGQAGAANPIPIVIPCHRVIGADGSLRGYAAGLEIKAWLLSHETKGLQVESQSISRVTPANR